MGRGRGERKGGWHGCEDMIVERLECFQVRELELQ